MADPHHSTGADPTEAEAAARSARERLQQLLAAGSSPSTDEEVRPRRARHAAPDESEDEAEDAAAPVTSEQVPAGRPVQLAQAGPAGIAPVFQRGEPPLSSSVLIERSADIALAAAPVLLRVLDVGCGDGALLHEIALRVPYAEAYVGVDPDGQVLAAAAGATDPRLEFRAAHAAGLPFADRSFDLVTTVRSLHLWTDQPAGLRELARVVTAGGHVVVVDRLGDAAKGSAVRSAGDLKAAADAVGLRFVGAERVTGTRLLPSTVRAYVYTR